MATELTISLPDPLLKEARQAAEATKTTLEAFVSQAVLGYNSPGFNSKSHPPDQNR